MQLSHLLKRCAASAAAAAAAALRAFVAAARSAARCSLVFASSAWRSSLALASSCKFMCGLLPHSRSKFVFTNVRIHVCAYVVVSCLVVSDARILCYSMPQPGGRRWRVLMYRECGQEQH